MYRFVMDNRLENDVISFVTDFICTTKRLDLKSSRLGDFSLDKEGNDAYYLQNGLYRFNGIWKHRGVATLNGRTFEHIESIENAAYTNESLYEYEAEESLSP